MRICKCGGKITQHELTGNREAWHCRDCGRYEKVNRNDTIQPSSADTQDNHEATFSCVTSKGELMCRHQNAVESSLLRSSADC